MQAASAYDPRLARDLILDELFDLSLYKALRAVTQPDVHDTLDELIKVETAHLADRKSTRLNSSHSQQSRMPSSA